MTFPNLLFTSLAKSLNLQLIQDPKLLEHLETERKMVVCNLQSMLAVRQIIKKKMFGSYMRKSTSFRL